MDPEDQWWVDGPEFDERGYQIVTDEDDEPVLEQEVDENEDPIFDENGEPVMNYAASYSCMQTDDGAVDSSRWTGYGRVLA